MLWRISVSLTLVAFVWCGWAISSGEVDGNEASKLFITEFPRNISHIFKGSWHFLNESNPRNVGFGKTEGAIWFSLKNVKFSEDVDMVHGEAVVRDGVYSTDENMKFLLQGAYFFHLGTLLLIAKPATPYVEEVVPQANFSVLINMTIDEALEVAEQIIINETRYYNGSAAHLCPFRFVLQMQPDQPTSLAEKLSKPDIIQPDAPASNSTTGGQIFSSLCNVVMSITAESVNLSDYMSKWINYVVMVSLSSFLQIWVLVRQMEYTGTQAGASKMSLLTVGSQAVLDVYLCLIHLVAGILIEQMFTAFVTAAFFQFVTFLVFEMRYLMVILKARRPQAFAEGWLALRREFSLFYLRFYTFVVGGFVLIFYMSHLFYIFIFIMHSFWVPQIICNAQKCARRPVLWQYAIGMSVTRLTIPLYFYGCPHNFLSVEPSFNMCFLLVTWMGTQVLVMHLQDTLGPQFFVPKMFLPVKYDYGRPLQHSMSEDQRNCVICMREVEVEDPDHMITPCDHIFHTECLSQWLDVKMECPTCRRNLPVP